MRVLMIAPPGAGKGTQAERLSARFGIDHLSSGALLRDEVRVGSDLGRRAAPYLARGDLVPDDVVLAMVLDRVRVAAAAGGYVLEGFPRTVPQARAAAAETAGEQVAPQVVICLDVPDPELRRRMLGRAATDHRSDDRPEVIDHRLAVYRAETRPLLDYYQARGLLREVDGSGPVDDVHQAILGCLASAGLV